MQGFRRAEKHIVDLIFGAGFKLGGSVLPVGYANNDGPSRFGFG